VAICSYEDLTLLKAEERKIALFRNKCARTLQIPWRAKKHNKCGPWSWRSELITPS